MAQAGSLYTSLSLESASFITGLKKAAQQTAESAASIEQKLDSIVNFGKAAFTGAIAQQILALGQRALDYASSLDEVAQQAGVSAEQLQVFRYAASQVGVSQDEMDTGLRKLTKTIGDAAAGVKAPVEAFRRLGVSVRDSNGGLLSAGDVIPRIADALAKVPDPAVRARAEFELFGKAGQKLDNLLSGGSSAIDGLTKAARDLGIVLSERQIQEADNTADKLSELKQVLEANVAGVVADNARAIYDFAVSIENLVVHLKDGVQWLYAFNKAASNRILGPDADQPKAPGFVQGLQTLAERFVRSQFASVDTSGGQDRVGSGPSVPGLDTLVTNALKPKPGRFETVDDNGAAARKTAQDAERARRKALAQEDAYQNELARNQDEYLRLRGQLTSDVREQAQYEHEAIERAAAARGAAHDRDVADGRLTAARAAELKAAEARTDELNHARVNRELDNRLAQQQLDFSLAGLANQRDVLAAQDALATSSGERRDLELRLLDLQFDEERARQEAVLASRESTDAEKKIARARLDVLGNLQTAGEENVRRNTAGAGESYLRGLNRTPGQIADDLESSGVSALERFNASLDKSVKSALHLHGVFGDIVSDLVDMAIKQAIIKPIAESLFGGGSASGVAGLIGKAKTLFSGLGFAGGGRPPLGQASRVGEDGPEWFIPDVPGRIISNDNFRTDASNRSISVNVDARGASDPQSVQRAVQAGMAEAYAASVNHTNDMFRVAGRQTL